MTAQSFAIPRHDAGSFDNLVDELTARWDGAGAPASAIAKAARMSPGFTARHLAVRQDRQLVANAAWGLAFLFALATTVLASGLVELLIAPAEELVRIALSALLLGLAGLGLSRTECRLMLQVAVMGALSIVITAAPAAEPGLAAWDVQAALLGWAVIAAKAIRLALDNRLDRAEATLLLKAAGCR